MKNPSLLTPNNFSFYFTFLGKTKQEIGCKNGFALVIVYSGVVLKTLLSLTKLFEV